MFEIRPIRQEEVVIAKQLIFAVAHEVFHDPLPLEESTKLYVGRGELADMDDVQRNYFENGGAFLVMLDDKRIIGTGAIRRLEKDTCELKRLWFDTQYHGRGLGYRMMMELFSIARAGGYKKMRLQTDARYQSRALSLYRRLGFYDIPMYRESKDDVSLEIRL